MRLYLELMKLELTRDDIIDEMEVILEEYPDLETPNLAPLLRARPEEPGRDI